MQTWEFRSKSNPSLVHKVQGHEDGTLSCSCNGWRNKKADKPRECTHTRQVIAGGFKPVIAAPAPVVDEDGFPEPMSASALTVNILQGELTRQEFKRQFPPDAWVGEDKIDGQRILLRVQNHVVTKWGASNVTLPLDLVDHLCRLRDGLYDGELAIPGMTSTDVPNLELRDKLTVYLFDMLELLEVSTRPIVYLGRRVLLENSVAELPEAAWGRVRVVTQHPRPTLAMVEKVWAKGGEGMILKRLESFYEDGVRSGDWVKVKRIEAHTVTLIGFQQGLDGPTGIIRYRFDDGVEGTTRNTTIKRQQETAKNPKAYIGRRFVLEMQQRHVSGAAMQPRFSAWKDEPATFDHWAGKAE